MHVSHDLPLRTLSMAVSTAQVLTGEQEEAAARRRGPLLLAAGAGSGKTSVLVERFVRAVREDGIAPGRILAITFTERTAAELRERVRARLLELGEREAARDTEGAPIGTFHGFCARLLRVHALTAGLDPDFAILDEVGAARLRLLAFRHALAALLAETGTRAERGMLAGGECLPASVEGECLRLRRGAPRGGHRSARRLRRRPGARDGGGRVRRAAQPRGEPPLAAPAGALGAAGAGGDPRVRAARRGPGGVRAWLRRAQACTLGGRLRRPRAVCARAAGAPRGCARHLVGAPASC